MTKFYVEQAMYPGKLFAFNNEDSRKYHLKKSDGFTALTEQEAEAAYGKEAMQEASDPIVYMCFNPLPKGYRVF